MSRKGCDEVRAVWSGRLHVLFVFGVAQVVLLAGAASALGVAFSDNFGSFDAARWTKESHALGRSELDPANVDVAGGKLRVKIPAGTLDGGEIRSNSLYYHGSYVARMKLPHAPSSITGFFLYRSPDYAREIDIELFNDSTRRIMFTTYAGGRQTNTATMRLPFDATAAYHTYAFRYGPGVVRFYVDGKVVKTFKDGVPNSSMYLYTNTWFPAWLDGKAPTSDRYLMVDWISYSS